MSDVLAQLPPKEVAKFYARLADGIDQRKGKLDVSLAAMLLKRWLANKPELFEFQAPSHLIAHPLTVEAIEFHRHVYLTDERARFTGGNHKWAGIIPRLQGRGYPAWDGVTNLTLTYESLIEIPLLYQWTGSDADLDLLYALRGFQLKTTIVVKGLHIPNSNNLKIEFLSFTAEALDRYDWDYSEHITVPNPDYQSKLPGAVAPSSKKVVVYHKNAKRLEDAGLAAPYDLRTKPWVVDSKFFLPAVVDPSRSL